MVTFSELQKTLVGRLGNRIVVARDMIQATLVDADDSGLLVNVEGAGQELAWRQLEDAWNKLRLTGSLNYQDIGGGLKAKLTVSLLGLADDVELDRWEGSVSLKLAA